jgi:SAM-dependent methyltransferase
MSTEAIQLEEERLTHGTEEKPLIRERHRAFPFVFENRQHNRILDSAAGLGYTAQQIQKDYKLGQILCNDITPTCLMSLKQAGLPAMRFNLDNDGPGFPIADGSFDAVISSSTIEHLLHVDEFLKEVYRILEPEGYFYISTPNYASPIYLWPVIWAGRTFHDPMKANLRYEFFGHVRYFTYRTMLEYVPTFGFVPEAVYIPLPKSSTIYQGLRKSAPLKALIFRLGTNVLYRLSPRWASEPILCFRKTDKPAGRLRKVIF